MTRVLIIVLGSALAALIPITAALLLVRRMLARRVDEARATLSGETVLAITGRANFLGVKSKGLAQVRGNGVLALTGDRLVFFMLAPRKTYEVPLRMVSGIEHPRWFNGKSVFYKLLVVLFTAEDGMQDAIGFYVPDPLRWGAMISRVASGRVELRPPLEPGKTAPGAPGPGEGSWSG